MQSKINVKLIRSTRDANYFEERNKVCFQWNENEKTLDYSCPLRSLLWNRISSGQQAAYKYPCESEIQAGIRIARTERNQYSKIVCQHGKSRLWWNFSSLSVPSLASTGNAIRGSFRYSRLTRYSDESRIDVESTMLDSIRRDTRVSR